MPALILAAALATTLAPAAPDPKALEAYRALCEASGADSCLVVHRGKPVLDWRGPGYRGIASMMSGTKSVTALLVGMLVEDGKLASIDEPVGRYLPEWAEGPRAAVTIRHLLSHTSGLDLGHDPRRSVGTRGDKSAYVRSLVPANPPGVAFSYSNEGVQLLAPLLAKAAGEPLNAYAARRLFGPLGLTRTRFHEYPPGDPWTYADLESDPGEFARIGKLMLDGGTWGGKRLVSRWWVDQLTAQAQPFEPTCGLLWWRDPELGEFGTRGFHATDMHVFRARDLVVVRTQHAPGAMAEDLYAAKSRPLFRRLLGLPAAAADAAPIAAAEALAAYRAERWADAVAAADGAIAVRGAAPEAIAQAHVLAGLAAHRLGRPDAARAHLAAYRALAPRLPASHWTRGSAEGLAKKLEAT